MDEIKRTVIPCSSCGKMLSKDDIYLHKNRRMCDESGFISIKCNGFLRGTISEGNGRLNFLKP